MKRLIGIVVACCVLAAILFIWSGEKNTLKSVVLTSPRNTAMYNKVDITIAKPAPVYVEYTEKATGKSYRTRISPADTIHHLDLLLLKANTEYTYRVVIDNLFKQKSAEMSFKTREQSPWLVNHWFDESRPHDTSALGDGMILVCFGRLPGSMMLIDGKGDLRWYWQVEDIGVRAVSITPQGTFLAMLRPALKDVVDDNTMTPEQVRNDEHKKPMRRGSIGFAGGTGLAEVSLTGETMWRLYLNKVEKEKDYQVIHHDILMDKDRLLPYAENSTPNAFGRVKMPRYINMVESGSGVESDIYHEINPTLNTDTRLKGINALLSQIGYKIGFANGYFVFNETNGVQTATQVEADQQRTIQFIKDVRDKLENCLDDLITALNAFADLYGLAPAGAYEVTYDFGDITYNREEDRARWWSYVTTNKGPAWMFFTKFEGMSEEEAKAMVAEASPQEPTLFGGEE